MIDSFVVYLFLFLSGSPFIGYFFGWDIVLVCSGLFLFALLVLRKQHHLETSSFLIFSTFVLIFILQSAYFGSMQISTNFGFLIRLFIAYATVKLVYQFPVLLFRAMASLCLMSLVFWIIGLSGFFNSLLGFFPQQSINEWTEEVKYLLFFHTYIVDSNGVLLRNAGIFWEPGAFAGYLNLSLLLLILSKGAMKAKEYRRYFLLYVLTILTTFSSQGYFVLPLVLLTALNLHSSSQNQLAAKFAFMMLGLFALTAISLVGINKLDFLGEKFKKQWVAAIESSDSEISSNQTRIGSALFDWQYIKESPVVGNGLHEETRYRYHLDDLLSGYSNGFTDYIAKFGLLGLLLFLYYLFRSMRILSGSLVKSLWACLLLCIMLNGQAFLNYPFYMSLMFLGVVSWRKYHERIMFHDMYTVPLK
jgi:hypothetical protein